MYADFVCMFTHIFFLLSYFCFLESSIFICACSPNNVLKNQSSSIWSKQPKQQQQQQEKECVRYEGCLKAHEIQITRWTQNWNNIPQKWNAIWGGMTTFNIHKLCAPLLHHCTTHSPMLAFSISFSLLLRSCLALYDPIRAYFGMCKKFYDVIGVFVYGRTIFAHVCVSLSHKCACIAAQNVEPNWKFVHCRMHTVTNGSSSNSSSSNGHQQTFSIGMFTGVYEFIVIVPCKQCTDVMCATSQTTAQPICSRWRNTRLSWCLDNAAVPFKRARVCVCEC